MSDPPVGTCPKCKKRKVEKLISQTAFLLKGGGWYKDLYSSSKPGAEAKEDGAGSSAKDGAGNSETGSKESPSASDGAAKATKKETKTADTKDTKKKDSPKKSEARAA
jgi:predicted nucleic acid-binding Zn ribbon protein